MHQHLKTGRCRAKVGCFGKILWEWRSGHEKMHGSWWYHLIDEAPHIWSHFSPRLIACLNRIAVSIGQQSHLASSGPLFRNIANLLVQLVGLYHRWRIHNLMNWPAFMRTRGFLSSAAKALQPNLVWDSLPRQQNKCLGTLAADLLLSGYPWATASRTSQILWTNPNLSIDYQTEEATCARIHNSRLQGRHEWPCICPTGFSSTPD